MIFKTTGINMQYIDDNHLPINLNENYIFALFLVYLDETYFDNVYT